MFGNCEGLTGITIPETVITIGESAFSNCNGLSELIIPASVEEIVVKEEDGVGAFGLCRNLARIWVDEDNLNYSSDQYGRLFNKDKTKIIRYPQAHGNTEYDIPEGVTRIETGAFKNCLNLTRVAIPDSVTSIGSNAFYYCKNLEEIRIPEKVTKIEEATFYGCEKLTNIIIPNRVESIGNRAFKECTNLGKVVIPNSVRDFGDSIFHQSDNVNIICRSNSPASRHAEAKDISYTLDDEITTPGSVIMRLGNSDGAKYESETWTSENVYIEMIGGSDDLSGHKSTVYKIEKGTETICSNEKGKQDLKEEGEYVVTVTTTDYLDNTEDNVFYVNIDKTAPTPATMTMILGGVDGTLDYISNTWTNEDVHITLNDDATDTGSGVAETRYKINGEVGSRLKLLDKTGVYNIEITTTDNVGLTETRSYVVKIDKDAPTLGKIAMNLGGETGAIYDNNTWTKHPVYINVSDGSDGEAESGHRATTYTVNGVTSESKVLDPGEGNTETYKIVVTTADIAGNTSTGTYTVRIDRTAPTAGTIDMKLGDSEGEKYESGTWTNQNVYIQKDNGTDDGGSGHKVTKYTVKKDGEDYLIDQTENITLEVEEGKIAKFEIEVTTEDRAGGHYSEEGNKNTNEHTYKVWIDKKAPIPSEVKMNIINNDNTTGDEYQNDTWTNKSVRVELQNNHQDEKNGVKRTTYKVDGIEVTANPIDVTETGIHSIEVITEDNVGNIATRNYTIKIDKEAPTVGTMIMKLGDNKGAKYESDTWTNQNVYIKEHKGSDSLSGHSTTVYNVKKGEETIHSNKTGEITIGDEGEYTVTVTTTDIAGNSDSDEFTIKIDKEAPEVNVEIKEERESVILTIEATDNVDLADEPYSFDDGDSWQSGNTKTYTRSETVKIAVKDKAGNVNEKEIEIEISIEDKTAPTIKDVTGVPQNWTNQDVTLTIKGAEDNGELAEQPYSFDGGISWQSENTKPFTENTTVKIRVKDKEGNIYEHQDIVIDKIDKVAPTVGTMDMKLVDSNGAQYTAEEWTKEDVYISVVNGSDQLSGHKTTVYTVNDGEPTKEPQTLTETGTYTIKVITTDNAGNSDIATYTVNIDKENPTVGTITMNVGDSNGVEYVNNTWTAGSVQFTVEQGSDKLSAHKTTVYSVKKDDTVIMSGQAGETKQITEPGMYTIEITTTDNVGNTAKEEYTVKIDKMAPTITEVTTRPTTCTDGTVTLAVVGASDNNLSGLAEEAYSFDGGASWQKNNTKVYSQNTTGIVIKVRDNMGNVYTHETIDIVNIGHDYVDGRCTRCGDVLDIEVSSPKFKIENPYISNVRPKTTVGDFKYFIETNATTINIYDKDGEKLNNNDLITTGTTIELKLGEKTETYTIIVIGDIDGDGKITITDMSLVNRHRLHKTQLEGVKFLAADVTGEGVINFLDLVKISRYKLSKL